MVRRGVAMVLAASGVVEAQERAPAAQAAGFQDRVAAAGRFVERNYARLGLPGVAVSISTTAGVVGARGFGQSATGDSIRPDAPMHIGSVTKTLTAYLVAELATSQRLNLDDPVEEHLPDFTMGSPFSPRSITLRHLLTHRSGLSQWSGHDARAQHEGQFSHLRPKRAPGERAEYSSLNFIIAGRVAEEAAQVSYATMVDSLLRRQLGMSSVFADAAERERPADLVVGHRSYFGWQRSRVEPRPPRYLVPAGFVAASAMDLGRFSAALLGGGRVGGDSVASPVAMALVLGDSAARPLAFGRSREDGSLMLEHAGNSTSSSARLRVRPERGYAIAVLANTNSGPFFSATGDLMDGIDAILAGEPVPSVWPRERLFRGLLLVGTLLSVGQLGRQANRWNAAGRPTQIQGSTRVLVPLALDVAGGTFLLFGLPRLVGVPLSTMMEYFPDLGIALTVSAAAGMAGGVLRAATASTR